MFISNQKLYNYCVIIHPSIENFDKNDVKISEHVDRTSHQSQDELQEELHNPQIHIKPIYCSSTLGMLRKRLGAASQTESRA